MLIITPTTEEEEKSAKAKKKGPTIEERFPMPEKPNTQRVIILSQEESQRQIKIMIRSLNVAPPVEEKKEAPASKDVDKKSGTKPDTSKDKSNAKDATSTNLIADETITEKYIYHSVLLVE